MNFQAIILAGLMTLGVTSFAQEKSEGKHSDKPSVEKVERGPRGKGPQFRGGRGGKEIQKCEVCQAHRKHMKEVHPNVAPPHRQAPPQNHPRR